MLLGDGGSTKGLPVSGEAPLLCSAGGAFQDQYEPAFLLLSTHRAIQHMRARIVCPYRSSIALQN